MGAMVTNGKARKLNHRPLPSPRASQAPLATPSLPSPRLHRFRRFYRHLCDKSEKHRASTRKSRSRLKEKRDAPVVGDGDVGFPRGDGARACFFAAALGRRRAFDVHSERPSVFFFFSF